jgi:hypothetical protein
MSTRPSDRAILRELLRGAAPVCLDCRETIPPGAARVAVGGQPWPAQVFWRCGDCEYRGEQERMRAAAPSMYEGTPKPHGIACACSECARAHVKEEHP